MFVGFGGGGCGEEGLCRDDEEMEEREFHFLGWLVC